MLVNSLLLVASATLALATPTYYNDKSGCAVKSSPVLPINGGERELPSPPTNVTLKHIALGTGIQNYTCSGAGAQPTAQGAIAMLYDITSYYPTSKLSSRTASWNGLTASALNTKFPLNFIDNGFGVSATDPFPDAEDPFIYKKHAFPFLGHHYFNAAGVPVFDLTDTNEIMFAKKLDGIKASSATNVDWLLLADAGGSSATLKYVYRVNTFAGVSHGCVSQGTESQLYTTMYWFYG